MLIIIIRYKHKTKGCFINATGLLDCREPSFSTLSDQYIVPNSLSPRPSFLSSFSQHGIPLHVSVCALRPTLCSPPLSPSSCLVFSWPVCVSGVLPGAGVMHYRSKGLR